MLNFFLVIRNRFAHGRILITLKFINFILYLTQIVGEPGMFKGGRYRMVNLSLPLLALALASCQSTDGMGGANSKDNKTPDQPTAAMAKAEPGKFDVEIKIAAQQAEAGRKYLEAAQHYHALMTRDPGNLEFGLGLGRNLRYGGSAQQDIDLMTSLMQVHGRIAVLLLELGKAYVSTDQMNLAVPILEEARARAPESWEVWSALGVAFDYQAKFDQAREAYAQSLLLSPRNPDVLNNLALSQAQSGDLDGAIATLEQAADQPLAVPQIRQNLALMMALKGDPEAAERWARKDLPASVADENAKFYQYLSEGKTY
jgi:Flp pilus assembly protein TadD